MIGRFLTFVAALTALALAAALILPAITDWTSERAPLEARLSAAIGGPVALNGAVKVRVLPTPRLTASDVDLSDSDGRLTIEGANVGAELDLWSLLLGRVVVNRIVLARGTMRLDGDAATLRGLVDELATRLSAGQGTYRYVFAPNSLQWGSLTLATPRAEVWSSGPDTPVRMTFGAGVLNADATLRPQADQSWQMNARAVWGDELIEARFNGRLDSFAAGASVQGDVAVTSENLSALWGAEDGPALTVRGLWDAAGNIWRAEGLDVTLGSARGTLDVHLDTQTAHFFDVNLSTSLADVDALGVGIADVRNHIAAALSGGQAVQTPPWLNGRVRVDANGLLLGGRAIRDSAFDFLLTSGEVTLTSADAQLPGGTHAVLAPRRDRARRLVVTSDNLRALLDWAGYDVTSIPGDRLQAFSLDAAIREGEGPRYISFDRIELDGGSADGVFEETGDGRFEVTMAANGLDLDAYAGLGGPALGFIARMRAFGGMLVEDRLSAISLSGVDVRLGGAAVEQIHFAAQHIAGRLIVDEARISFAGGGALYVRGSWAPDADMSLRVSGSGIAPSLFDGLPLSPRTLADLDMTLERHGGSATLNGTLRSEGLQLEISGAESADAELTAWVAARGETPGALATALGLEALADAASEQPELLTIDWTGPLSGGDVLAQLELPQLSLRAGGPMAAPLSPDVEATLTIDGVAGSLQDLLAGFGGPTMTALEGMPVSGDGQLRLSEGRWRLTSANLALGDQTALVDFSRALSGEGPLTGRVGLERLTLAPPVTPQVLGEDDVEDDAPRLAWSTTVFESEWLNEVDAGLTIDVGALHVGDTLLTDATARMVAGSGALTISSARARMDGGEISGSGSVAIDGAALILAADVAAQELPAAWLTNIAGLPALSGQIAIAAHLTSRGRSPFDLVAGLSGRIDLGLDQGSFDTIALGPFLEAVETVRTRRALREAANGAMANGRTPFVRLGGSASVARGVVDLRGLEGIAETGPFTLSGTLDLRSQIVDVEALFQLMDKQAGSLPVLVAFRGAGDVLSQSIDITLLQEGIGTRLTDTPEGLLSEEDLPEDLQELLREYEDAFPEGAD